jgi:hypothetical protein
MIVRIVETGDVDKAWPKIAGGMQRSCDRTGGELSSGYLWQECRSGHAFLVLVHDETEIHGAAVVRFEYWPSGTRLRGLGLCGKNMKAWFGELRAFAMEMARRGGAVAIVDSGRPGLKKFVPEAKPLSTLYEVRL